MSKFTFDKLKGSASGKNKTTFPAFRFHKDGEEMEVVEQEEGGFGEEENSELVVENVAIELSNERPDGLPVESENVSTTRETSPIKEAILTRFAKLAPAPADVSGMSRSESTDSQESGSWLNQVVKNSVEKYTKMKADRLARNLQNVTPSSSLDLEDSPQHLATADPDQLLRMSHSQSEIAISEAYSEIEPTTQQRPHSQIFDMEFSGIVPPSADDILRNEESPNMEKKKFNISSFLDRSVSGSPVRAGPDESKFDSPRRSLRARMMSYVGKSASPIPPVVDRPLDDPFSGLALESGEIIRIEENDSVLVNECDAELEVATEVEEGLEAAEDELTSPSVPDMFGASTSTSSEEKMAPTQNLFGYINFYSVIILLLSVIQVTAIFPPWISGFITGVLLCCLLCAKWIIPAPHPPMRPRTLTSLNSISEQGEPVLVQTWMNLLPIKHHPYDVEKYEVRNTFSVRVTVEHHMMKIEYPEKNICRRINEGDAIPTDIKFLLHSDHIDLSTAKISLLPEDIASKRKFSKKYPIEIRPNVLAKVEERNPAALPESPTKEDDDLSKNTEYEDDDDDDTFHDIDNPLDECDDEAKTPKVFYLFARADREKEDMYKALLDGHWYLKDTLLDLARKCHVDQTGLCDNDNDWETALERSNRFKDFMGRVMGSQMSEKGQDQLADTITTKESSDKENPIPSDKEATECSDNGNTDHGTPDALALDFLNTFLNRIFYDIHKSDVMKSWLKDRIYRKLLKIKITQWFKSINVTEIDMGTILPRITKVCRPTQDEHGLWVELEIDYGGVARAAIESIGLNLGEEPQPAAVNLKSLIEEGQAKEGGISVIRPNTPERKVSSRREAATNSDEEDSAEEDDEDSEEALHDTAVILAPGSTEESQPKSRWWEVVGSSELVKTGINRLSNSEWWKSKTNKKITLYMEVHALKGGLVLNIPPPPTDRIWYGFRESPHFDLRLVPYYGDIQLGTDNTFVSSAINKGIEVLVGRLKMELHKFILLPNMDDIPVKIMDSLPTSNEDKA